MVQNGPMPHPPSTPTANRALPAKASYRGIVSKVLVFTLLLLRCCASYCTLVHLARSTPSFLVSEGLALFGVEVHLRCCECVEIVASDSDRLQVQLSLSRGGLGLSRGQLVGVV